MRHFSRENGLRFAELRHIGQNRGTFGKKCRNTLPAQIQKQTIKVWHVSYQKVAHKFFISVVFFLTYTIYCAVLLQHYFITINIFSVLNVSIPCTHSIHTHHNVHLYSPSLFLLILFSLLHLFPLLLLPPSSSSSPSFSSLAHCPPPPPSPPPLACPPPPPPLLPPPLLSPPLLPPPPPILPPPHPSHCQFREAPQQMMDKVKQLSGEIREKTTWDPKYCSDIFHRRYMRIHVHRALLNTKKGKSGAEKKIPERKSTKPPHSPRT